jgi:chromatin segregation and condensation protein Rec8/ScpA/Scc1 (kleisin family)
MTTPESKADLIRRTEAFLQRHERARKLVEREERLNEAIKTLGAGNGFASNAERDKVLKALVTLVRRGDRTT